MSSGRIALAFAHANSYPAASYAPLFAALEAGFEVHAHPKLGHDPLHPVSDCWPGLVREYESWLFAQPREGDAQAPWLLVGHSLGGFLSLMVAARHPQKVRGVVLLDSPIVGGWQASLLWFGKRAGLAEKFSPARFAIKRRDRFDSVEDAFMHLRGKGVFAEFSDEALRAYLQAGLQPVKEARDANASGAMKLAFDRRIEAHIYATLPHNMIATVRKLQRAAPALPVAFVGGSRSLEVKQVGLRYTSWLVTPQRMRTVEGTHLFPLERPEQTAQTIAQLVEEFSK
jgi:pimeloyl-ACP methyl ester carboxylesterase